MGMRELQYKLIFISTNVVVENNQFYEEMGLDDEEDERDDEERDVEKKPDFDMDENLNKIQKKLNEQERQMILSLKNNPNLYDDMAESIFPSIFGHS